MRAKRKNIAAKAKLVLRKVTKSVPIRKIMLGVRSWK